MIVAHPLDVASKAVLPNGSSHLEGTTEIEVLSNKLRTFVCFIKPSSKWLRCFINIFLLSSSPKEKAFQSGNSFNILIIDLENKS